MTSRAVTLTKVDEALVDRYSGITIDVGGIPTAVEVFMEAPMAEDIRERIYPSISIKLININENTEVLDSEDDLPEEIGFDTGVFPYERYMRKRPIPSILLYSISAWHKYRMSETRNLFYETFMRKTPPKGSLSIENIDGVDVDAWTFWSGGIVSDEELENDYLIYRHTLTLQILAELTQVGFDEYAVSKTVMEILWEVYNRKWIADGNGISILEGMDYLDAVVPDWK